jgi:hypothetical protein
MDMPLLDIILNSGIVGVVIWFFIFGVSLVSFLIGVLAIIQSMNDNQKRHPLALKLLISFLVATLLLGALGTVTGYIDTFAGLASATGAAKAQLLQLSLEQSLYNLYVSLISGFIQLIFIITSWIIINSKSEQPINGKIPILMFPIVLVSIPVLAGVCYSFIAIEKGVMLKPGEHLPQIMGIEFAQMLNICYISGFVGVFLLFVFLIKTIIDRFNSKLVKGY